MRNSDIERLERRFCLNLMVLRVCITLLVTIVLALVLVPGLLAFTSVGSDAVVVVFKSKYGNRITESTEIESVNVPLAALLPSLSDHIGSTEFFYGGSTFVMQDLPTKYYPGIDIDRFKPYMEYSLVSESSASGKVIYSEYCYNDENGFRRYRDDSLFSVDDDGDYVVAMGNYYKEKGTAGQRFLVVTTESMYTVIVGDEKSDAHTDPYHMFGYHNNGSSAGLLEFIVDQSSLSDDIRYHGTVTMGPIKELSEPIEGIYRIY